MWNFIVNSLKSNPITVISAVISILAFAFSYASWRKTRTSTLYSDIDGRYMDLLKLGISNPEFVNPVNTRDYKARFRDDGLLKYERYAFAAWNIVETIVDRRGDGHLEKTWYPVIKEENNLHRRWLNSPENQYKFKKQFWKFMIGNEAFPCPDCNGKTLCARCTELRNLVKSNQDIPVVTS